MSDQQRDEKEEKEEKRGQKEEKSWDEKWNRDPLSAIVWAGIFIWAGLVLLADNVGVLTSFERLEAWPLIFMGAGLIVLLEVVIRLLMPEYRRPVVGTAIFGVILLTIGLGDLISWSLIWAVALIVIGVVVLLRGVFGNR